jgi:hypothetical protein
MDTQVNNQETVLLPFSTTFQLMVNGGGNEFIIPTATFNDPDGITNNITASGGWTTSNHQPVLLTSFTTPASFSSNTLYPVTVTFQVNGNPIEAQIIQTSDSGLQMVSSPLSPIYIAALFIAIPNR